MPPSIQTTYLLELVLSLTPLFSGSGLCPWGRGGVFSLQEIVKLDQVQGYTAIAWLIRQNEQSMLSQDHPAYEPPASHH